MSSRFCFSARTLHTRATAIRLLPLFLTFSSLTSFSKSEDHHGADDLTRVLASNAGTVHPTFSVAVDTVLLSVEVEGANRELQAADFEILQDGVQQQVCYFSKGDQSLSVVLLLDTSESMVKNALSQAKAGAMELVEAAHPDTQFSLITFDSAVTRMLGFTSDRSRVREAINKLRATGSTRLFDGIASAVHALSIVEDRGRVIVLLTDGKDEGSESNFDEIERLLRENDIALFTCGVYNPAYRRLFMNDRKYYIEPEVENNLNPVWVLRRLAEVAATDALFPEPGDSLSAAFSTIAHQLRERYLLGFSPVVDREARFRQVQVRLKGLDSVVVRTRRGITR